MKAVLVEEAYKIKIVDIPMPEIRATDDVLIKVLYGGICGSDIAIYNGSNSLVTYPRIIGHEFCGEVIETGSAISHIRKGDVVTVDPVNSCGECYACKHGHHNVCKNLEVSGVHRNGGFSEYYLTKGKNCYKVDTSKFPKEFAATVEPYSIGCEINNRGRIGSEDMVVIMGSGPIGITAMQIAKARGAKVLMTDLIDSRLVRARMMGADATVNVQKENLRDAVLAFFGEEPTVIVDSVCSVGSPVEAMQLAAPAGRVVILGTRSDPTPVPQVLFTMKELDVLGSRLSNYCFPEVIDLMESGAISPLKLITDTVDYHEIEDVLHLIIDHPEKVCKVLLKF